MTKVFFDIFLISFDIFCRDLRFEGQEEASVSINGVIRNADLSAGDFSF